MDYIKKIALPTVGAIEEFQRTTSMMSNVDFDLDEIGGNVVNSLINGSDPTYTLAGKTKRDTEILNRAISRLRDDLGSVIDTYQIPLRNDAGFYIFDHWAHKDLVLGFLEEDN